MNIPAQIAKHLRDVYFGDNWTSVNMKRTLADVDWQQAITKVHSFNTIATLVHHTNYYVSAVSKVLEGEALNARDHLSFDHPPIGSKTDWDAMKEKSFSDAEHFASLIEQLHPSKLGEIFTDQKYGTYYRNLQGIVEHLHYHLGQIVLIKKILMEDSRHGK